ncbi:MAG TPA: hypothetical protein VLN59_18115 [Burkholderiales bacterium]|nr:hypothetical protein [Burkholderiales bacterium]
MYLVQLLLPLADNAGHRFAPSAYDRVRSELTQKFGGVTAFLRSPAEGSWVERHGAVSRDDVVIYEVMTEAVDREWWATYRVRLQQRFRQEELVVRASAMERL